MILLEPSFITSYWLVPFLYFCFIVKKEAIRKELKFYGRSLSIAASHNSVTKKKKIITITISAKKEKKRLYNANVKRTFPETVRLYPVHRKIRSPRSYIVNSRYFAASTRSRQGRDNWFAPSNSEHSHDCDRADLHGRGMWRERLSLRSRFLQTGAANHDRPWGRLISCRRSPHRNGSASIAGKHAIYGLVIDAL